MTKEEKEYEIARIAWNYWNWDKEPPQDKVKEMWDYIRAHADEFRGARPQ